MEITSIEESNLVVIPKEVGTKMMSTKQMVSTKQR